ncbi:MAG: phosphodiester glycosidase family protein [Clostridia bacterium]|nr:phosphodiester glycosidase family protein [Clostridia bacterium]
MTEKGKRFSYKKLIIIVVILAVLGTLYALADRYLIEHVQVIVKDNAGHIQTTATTTAAAITPQYDDWNYNDGQVKIAVKQVETGSGEDKITYFVADVQLADTSRLATAFAKNAYGTNIVETTSSIASNHHAILAINGDYYGFRNDGVLIRNGELYRDEPARTGLALYQDGSMKSYDEAQTDPKTLLANGVIDTFSFGPVLISNGVTTEDFGVVAIDKNMGNRDIQNANPRTGLGMIAPNHYVFIVVDGRSPGYSRGMTLTEFADTFKALGCTEAYNLDGGGSSTMYFMGRVLNNPQGKGHERAISDILYITGQEQ